MEKRILITGITMLLVGIIAGSVGMLYVFGIYFTQIEFWMIFILLNVVQFVVISSQLKERK